MPPNTVYGGTIMKTIKALTFDQPWASLIALGYKTVDTRHWQPPQSLVGQLLAIHAGKKVVNYQAVWEREPWVLPFLYQLGELPRGAVVAVALLREVLTVERVILQDDQKLVVKARQANGQSKYIPHDPWGDFRPGRYLWVLEGVNQLEVPEPAVGHQGIWNYTQE